MLRVLVIIGSDSDLLQCEQGLKLLNKAVVNGEVQVVGVFTGSIHRNTDEVLGWLREATVVVPAINCIITAAGWANHLTGTCDAYLRHTLKNNSIAVYGVAIEDAKNADHTLAACLSISEVPGTQVIFKDVGGKQFIGSKGFVAACALAISKKGTVIKLSETKLTQVRSLNNALEIIESKK